MLGWQVQGANEPNEVMQDGGFHNLVNEALTLPSNGQFP